MRLLPFLLLLWLAPASRAQETVHPLTPLSAAEIARAVSILQADGKTSAVTRFPLIALEEPSKEKVRQYTPGDTAPRRAQVLAYERRTNRTFSGVVDLTERRLVSWEAVPGVQPGLMLEDYERVAEIVRADPNFVRALRRRGIAAGESVSIETWGAGDAPEGRDPARPAAAPARLGWALFYLRQKAASPYARPIEGLAALVDINAQRVARWIDEEKELPVPQAQEPQRESPREALSPLRTSQPRGPGFTLVDGEVRWQRWRFRFGIHPREGLVLYTAGQEDGGKVRPLLYRASLSEMVVPYGDPSPAWRFRNAFDEGEYSLGNFVHPLDGGADVPAYATFFDAVVADSRGMPVTVPRAIALYERDGGVLWKHYGESSRALRRARQLVLVAWFTLGNYDYGFQWIFHLDGTLEAEVLLSGIMLARAIDPALRHAPETPASSHRVERDVAAVHHQHFFCFRLDLDVDGAVNRLVECEARTTPDGAYVTQETLLRRESEAIRPLETGKARSWKVTNPSAANALGEPAGYLLQPGGNSLPLAPPGSSVRRRAGFLEAPFWATPYAPGERYAAGEFPNQSVGGDGLPMWTRADRPLADRDIVLWYTVGVTHLPRPEEWPIMPVHRAGFQLVPAGFFARNPAMDLPVPSP